MPVHRDNPFTNGADNRAALFKQGSDLMDFKAHDRSLETTSDQRCTKDTK